MKQIKRTVDPDFLFVEPFELVITDEIRVATSMGLRDVKYEIGPYCALVDGPHFDVNWEERRPTLMNHITNADVVVVSRADLVAPDGLNAIHRELQRYVGTSHFFDLSTTTGQGLDQFMALIA
jgi:G3E family GTPase